MWKRIVVFLAILAQHLCWRYFGHFHNEYNWSSFIFLALVSGIVVFLWPIDAGSKRNKKVAD
jgi:hypothetical protein